MRKLIVGMLCAMVCANVVAQRSMTREEILQMSTQELSELSLEELMQAVETLGVASVDELFALIMNKNMSSASKEEEDSFSQPLSGTVITREEMRTYGISTIEEAFRLVPGMIVSEKTNGVYDVQMRGLQNIPDNNMIMYTENANILVMIDGRISHNYAVGAPYYETLPISIEDVERLEVIRGATSALYGPNAVNGVVNIITTKPDMAKSSVSGDVHIGTRTMMGDVALRRSFGDKVALGLTANGQMRQRKNSTIPFIPQEGYYVINDESVLGTALSAEDLQELEAEGTIRDISGGADLTVDEIMRLCASKLTDGGRVLYRANSEENSISAQWPDTKLSRETYGVNGYVLIRPSEKVRIDFTAGYQDSRVQTSPIGNENMSLRTRASKTGYGNLSVEVSGLRMLLNYSNGTQDFAVGSFGFGFQRSENMNGQIEYDFKVGELGIRLGVAAQRIYFKDRKPWYYDYNDGKGPQELSGYFGYYTQGNNEAEISDVAPSLRLDYKHEGLRLIGAWRADKTSIPDKWNQSWQFAASYKINERNFVRAVYGRSFRSASVANTSSNFNWLRASDPVQMQFLGNEETPLVHIDNVEIGYRWQPTQNLLIDAEAFVSKSKDYGELKAYESMLTLSGEVLTNSFGAVMAGMLQPEDIGSAIASELRTKSYIRYDDVPFKVTQMGISMNVDWIINTKLIAKLNANIQRTRIDDYYQYSQAEMIGKQLTASYMTTTSELPQLIGEILTSAMISGDPATYVANCTGNAGVETKEAMYNNMSEAEQEAYLQSLLAAANGGTPVEGVERPLSMYYGLKYNVRYNEGQDEYYMGTNVSEAYETTDNYKHKSIPAVYGMAGLIYKPTQKINVSAFANVMGKREFTTLFGTEKLDPRVTVDLKVGYKPMENFEFFVNAHNLFNKEQREFIYTDKIGGVYTMGINFGF